jgi:hypothetical protein
LRAPLKAEEDVLSRHEGMQVDLVDARQSDTPRLGLVSDTSYVLLDVFNSPVGNLQPTPTNETGRGGRNVNGERSA